MREPDQLVGRLAHRGEHRDDLRARLVRGDEPLGDALQLVGVADRGAAELHDDEPGRARRCAATAGTASNSIVVILRQCRQAMRRRSSTLREWVVRRSSARSASACCRGRSGSSESLKPHHVTNRWDLAWSGFDTGLAVLFLATAFAAYRRSPWVGALAAATGTLLVTDAWFDVVLESHADELRQSIAARGLRRAAAGGLLLLDRLPDRALPRAGARAGATSRAGRRAPGRG